MINFRTLTLENVTDLLRGTGYIVLDFEMKYAKDNDLFKYIGCDSNSARYLIGFEDEETEGNYYAAIVYVTIGCDNLQADYGGVPVFETTDELALAEYFERRCN